MANIDIDDFQIINDRFGHNTGDSVLKSIAKELKTGLRPYDFAARIGGDEFTLLLTETNQEQARDFLDRIRERFEAIRANDEFPLSFSAGVLTLSQATVSI